MASSFHEMASAKSSLLFCFSSVANVAVSFVPLWHMQAEWSIDTRNWPEMRVQTTTQILHYWQFYIPSGCAFHCERMTSTDTWVISDFVYITQLSAVSGHSSAFLWLHMWLCTVSAWLDRTNLQKCNPICTKLCHCEEKRSCTHRGSSTRLHRG